MFAAIRVNGTVGIRKDINDTLKMIRLTRPNHCVILDESEVSLGMLRKVHNYITWGNISPEVLEKLIEKRGKIKGNKPVEKAKLKGYVEAISKSESLKVKDMVPVLRLNPPLKGYKKTKLHYPKGALGDRKEKINELLLRMM